MFRTRSTRIGTALSWRRRSASEKAPGLRSLALKGSCDVALDRACGFKTGRFARPRHGDADPLAGWPQEPAPGSARGRIADARGCDLADGGEGRFAVRRRVAYPRPRLGGLEDL